MFVWTLAFQSESSKPAQIRTSQQETPQENQNGHARIHNPEMGTKALSGYRASNRGSNKRDRGSKGL